MTDPAGYSLTVPPGWTINEHFETGAFIRADITKDDEMGLQVRLADVKPSSFSSTVEAMIADYAQDITSHWGGYCNEIERIVPEAGYQSLTARFHAEYEDGRQWYLQISLVSKGSMMLILQCGCSWEDRQEGQTAFDRIVASISFNE